MLPTFTTQVRAAGLGRRGAWGGVHWCFTTTSLLGTSGASEPGAPKGSPHPPAARGAEISAFAANSRCCSPAVRPGRAGAIALPSGSWGAGAAPGQRGPGVLGSPPHPCPPLPFPAREVLASLPLQMLLYFNAYFSPVWCLAEGMMLQLKVPSQGAWGASRLLPGLPGHTGTTLRRGERSCFEMKGSPCTRAECPVPHKTRGLASSSQKWES